MTSPIQEWEDLLGQQVADGTRNDLDTASDRKYTPENHRVYRDTGSGLSRELLQYQDIGSLSWFHEDRAGDEDVFVLAPAAGNTIQMKSAKLLRYSVSFVAEFTQAFALNQSLANTNDRLVVGLDTSGAGDLSEGYFLKHTASHADDEVDLETRRAGNVVGDAPTVTLAKALTVFRRLIGQYAWYNVAGTEWRETTTTPGDVVDEEIETTTVEEGDSNAGDGGRGAISGNGRIVVEVEADSSTTGLELYVGSSSFKNLGRPRDLVLGKGFEEVGLSVASTGTYEPLFAIRRTPGYENVNLEIRDVSLTDGPNGKIQAIAVDPSKVLDGADATLGDADFSNPTDLSPNLLPVQVTDGATVDEFPNSSGTTVTSAADPGGYQLQLEASRATNTGSTKLQRGADVSDNAGVHDGDYALVIGNFESTNSTIKVFVGVGVDQ